LQQLTAWVICECSSTLVILIIAINVLVLEVLL
jgi:hypothetical protein